VNGEAVIEAVRKALGRSHQPGAVPIPPAIEEPLVRLVHTEIGLPELFVARAREGDILADLVGPDDLHRQLVHFLTHHDCRSVALARSPFLDRLGVEDALREGGLDVRVWPDVTLDEIYELDCGITDAAYAVAEVGGLLVRATPTHGRGLSLVPGIHVVIVEPRNLVPDLVDLFERLAADRDASAMTIITGPSKTADIEMNIVKGVHGPGIVQAFVLH